MQVRLKGISWQVFVITKSVRQVWSLTRWWRWKYHQSYCNSSWWHKIKRPCTAFRRPFCPKRLTGIHTYIHTLTVAAMHSVSFPTALQHAESETLNQWPSDNKVLTLTLSHSCRCSLHPERTMKEMDCGDSSALRKYGLTMSTMRHFQVLSWSFVANWTWPDAQITSLQCNISPQRRQFRWSGNNVLSNPSRHSFW